MLTRQKFIQAAAATPVVIIGAPFTLQSCSSKDGEGSYEPAVGSTWQSAKAPLTDGMLMRQELVRYATLAPSNHNTQCW